MNDGETLAKVFYADLWGLRSEKYEHLFQNDVSTTQWQELKPVAPYYFFVPKDFALQAEYDKFWKVSEIFKKWSFGVTTSRDHFVIGFTKEEIVQRLRTFVGTLSDELVGQALNLKDTGTWKLSKARQKVKDLKLEEEIYPYAYRPFDNRWICYESFLIERNRYGLMKHLLRTNIALCTNKILAKQLFNHVFASEFVGDNTYVSNITKERTYFFPVYLYPETPSEAIHELPLRKHSKSEYQPNFTSEFLQTMESSISTETTPEEIFYYIYAVLYSPTYRERYQEFLKIDFPRIPLPTDKKSFTSLSKLGKELVDLHLLRHAALDEHGIGFPISGSDTVEKVRYDEKTKRVYFNKDQCFEGISKEVWEYRIGAYQVMEKYLKDRKGRRLLLDEINHYMRVAKAIRMTIQLQERIDAIYRGMHV